MTLARIEGTARREVVLVAALALALLGSVGCEVDSFMDPSVTGRWENTPVVLPILDRLDVIDEPMEEIPGLSPIRADDLLPDRIAYRIGPGDSLLIEVQDLVSAGTPTTYPREVDELGMIPNLPYIGSITAEDKTARELEAEIEGILEPEFLESAIVTVIVTQRQERSFSVLGTPGTGTYALRQTNFKLLDAISMAGGIPPTTEKIYVFRQASLVEAEVGEAMDDQEMGEGDEPSDAEEADEGAAADPAALLEGLAEGLEDDGGAGAGEGGVTVDGAAMESVLGGDGAGGQYVHVPGRGFVWMGGGAGEGEEGGITPDDMVTQRVIEVDAKALMRGEAKYNIVVRPDDVIRVPVASGGVVFFDGPGISRAGVYNLPATGRANLKQMLAAAGGLSPIGIPERVDLVRRLGSNEEAIVRLNLRAIEEGVQPDLFLKDGDLIRVGTNLFASHLAVIRNSFRFSYGMGFLLDRNFGNDVFGAPPTNRGGQQF